MKGEACAVVQKDCANCERPFEIGESWKTTNCRNQADHKENGRRRDRLPNHETVSVFIEGKLI